MSENYHDAEKEAQSVFYQKVGDEITLARKRVGLTQEDLAWLSDISRVSIVNIESGKQRAPFHFLVSIGKILGIKIGDFCPDYTSPNVKSLDDLRKMKAKKFMAEICNHEALEEIVTLDGRKFIYCSSCHFSKPI